MTRPPPSTRRLHGTIRRRPPTLAPELAQTSANTEGVATAKDEAFITTAADVTLNATAADVALNGTMEPATAAPIELHIEGHPPMAPSAVDDFDEIATPVTASHVMQDLLARAAREAALDEPRWLAQAPTTHPGQVVAPQPEQLAHGGEPPLAAQPAPAAQPACTSHTPLGPSQHAPPAPREYPSPAAQTVGQLPQAQSEARPTGGGTVRGQCTGTAWLRVLQAARAARAAAAARFPQLSTLATARPRLRRWRYGRMTCGLAIAGLLCTSLFFFAVVPAYGRWHIRNHVLPKLQAKLGYPVRVKDIRVGWGWARLHGVEVGTAPSAILTVADTTIAFNPWAAAFGTRELTSIDAYQVRATLAAKPAAPPREATRLTASANDATILQPFFASVADALTALASLGNTSVRIRDLAIAAPRFATQATMATVTVRGRAVSIANLNVAWPSLQWQHANLHALVGTSAFWGTLLSPDVHVQGVVHGAGLHAHVRTRDPDQGTPLVLAVAASPQVASMHGMIAANQLRVAHHAIADRPIALTLRMRVRGSIDFVRGRIDVPLASVERGGVALQLAATAQLRGSSRWGQLRVSAPTVSCQAALAALPPELVPALAGYQLGGETGFDIRAAIDFNQPQNGVLTTWGGLDGCEVVAAPAHSPAKLTKPFTHRIETAPNVFADWYVGSKNPDFVDYDEIPDYVTHALVQTEDPTFFDRDGFAAPGVMRALAHTIKNRELAIGGSTIPMQLAKNLFLTGERTFARKLQELFLAWHIEKSLSRHRILELYLNVIEFGPGVFGLKRASRELFGKAIWELMPLDAAYFSAIVPMPRTAYANFCNRAVDATTAERIRRALTLMVNAGDITAEDWDAATASKIEFARSTEPLAACMARREAALRAFVTR